MITNIILHHVGNKLHGEGVGFADNELELTEEKRELLEHFFLSQISNKNETYKFFSLTKLDDNIVYKCVSDIFENEQKFKEQSKNIASHLYRMSSHPKAKGGEVFIVKMKDDLENFGEAIGVFKIENHDTFLKLKGGNDASVDVDKGVNLSKIDKGAIIFNHDKEDGYSIKIIDNSKPNTNYWQDSFLMATEKKDNYFNTSKMLSACKEFITEVLPQEYEVDRIDQADLLNKSMGYFKENENFELEDFTNSVLQNEDLIDSFICFKEDYEAENLISISDEFEISNQALKKQTRGFKSIIKLDKNFHIYVHGDRDLIEQGVDEKGRKFYKIYFKKEN